MVDSMFDPSASLEEMISVMSAVRISISDAGQLSPMPAVVPARKSRRPITVKTLKWMKSVERGRCGCKTALYLLCATHSLSIPAWLSAAQPASHDL